MSRSYRGVLLAIIVVASIATAIAVTTWPKIPRLSGYSYGNPGNAEYRPGGYKCEPEFLSTIKDRVQLLRQTDTCSEQAESYRQNTNDLTQQTRAADASEAQAQIASQGLWTAWFQTIGGFLTLAAAVAAAWYARDAARHTGTGAIEAKRTADSAERQLVEAKNTVEDNRIAEAAYLVMGVNLVKSKIRSSKGIIAEVCIINLGRTVADIITTYSCIGDSPPPWLIDSRNSVSGFSIAAGQSIILGRVKIYQNCYFALVSEYVDIFGVTCRFVDYCYVNLERMRVESLIEHTKRTRYKRNAN